MANMKTKANCDFIFAKGLHQLKQPASKEAF